MASHAHDRYLRDTVLTASPGKLLVMLYERLVRDLSHGEIALRGGDRQAASQQLIHAQDIIMELRASLNIEAWDGAPQLAGIYTFLVTELITANVQGDADRVVRCRDLVLPLLDAWKEAIVLADHGNSSAQPVGARVA